MSADRVDAGDLRLVAGRSRGTQASAKFYKLSHLRKLRGTEQVAAVCYRIRANGIEFLLVQTRGGRWTFPKGGVEPGLTHAQAAALEAFEEAGVHGRMEETPFARYLRGKRDGASRMRGTKKSAAGSTARSPGKELAVHAHLCEVTRLGPPQESDRNPTWFSAEKAKRRLREDRSADHASDLAHIVDRAVMRIRRLAGASEAPAAPANLQPPTSPKDALQRVQFETGAQAVAYQGIQGISATSFSRYIGRQGGDVRQSAEIELAVNAYLCKALQLGPAKGSNGNLASLSSSKAKRRLRDRSPEYRSLEYQSEIPAMIGRYITRVPQLRGETAVEAPDKVTQIDNPRSAGRSKPSASVRKNR